jgi:hypothetical protein
MSDGQFSSKPMRSGRPREWVATDITAHAHLLADDARAFMQSHAVQDEINALMDHPLPELVATVQSAPLHKAVPEDAKELGRPLASAVLVQEYLIGLLFLRFWGWVFMLFGALILFSAVVLFFQALFGRNPADRSSLGPAVLVAGFGLGIGGAGLWFGVLRGRVIDEMCWFCPRGMIWRTGLSFDWFTWEEVRELYSLLHTPRPAIAIRLDSNLSEISFSNTPASRRLIDYLERRASADCAPIMLQQIAEGRSLRFGNWRLSRSALRDGDAEIAWHDISDIQLRERELRIRLLNGRDVTILLEEIAFPHLFVALARGIHAYSRGR